MPTKKITTESKVSLDEQDTNSYEKPMKKFGSAFSLILLALVVVSGAAAAYFYNQWNALKTNPQVGAQQEAEALIERVSKLIVLPEDETPTIATVTDPEVLREQAFFVRAKAGDKVLIYTNARKAILYDPAANKIVEVAPINIGNPEAVPAEEVLVPPPAGLPGQGEPEEETPQP